MRKPRKNDTPVEKVAILRRHLIDHAPVSDLCDEHPLSPTLFYTWQKQFFENGPLQPAVERVADRERPLLMGVVVDRGRNPFPVVHRHG